MRRLFPLLIAALVGGGGYFLQKYEVKGLDQVVIRPRGASGVETTGASWTPDSLICAFSAGTASMAGPPRLVLPTNFQIVVAHDLAVTGVTDVVMTNARGLVVGGDLILNQAQFTYGFRSESPDSLSITGAVVFTNGAQLILLAASTNGSQRYGGLLDLTGRDVVIPTNCQIRLHSDPTNGGSIQWFAQSVTVQGGGVIDASGKGFQYNYGPGRGSGSTVGGSHGGRGGSYTGLSGPTNGS